MLADVLLKFLHRALIFFNSIPFVHNDDNSFTSFVCIARNSFILLNNAFLAVKYNSDNIRAVNGF